MPGQISFWIKRYENKKVFKKEREGLPYRVPCVPINRAQSFSTVPAHVKKVSCAEQTRGEQSSRFPLAEHACSTWKDTPAYQSPPLCVDECSIFI